MPSAANIADEHAEGDTCPACGDGELVTRTNRETEEPFLGCSNYPDCRFTQAIRSGWDRRYD